MGKWRSVLGGVVASLAVFAMLAPSAVAADAGVAINETNFPDAQLREQVQHADMNNDGVLSSGERTP